MADSWRTSRTRQAQQAAAVRRPASIRGPWDADGNLQLPEWMKYAPPMPETWPVEYMWMVAGRAALAGQR